MFGYVFTVLTLNFALDSTFKSMQKIMISVMRQKKIVPKSNINGSESELLYVSSTQIKLFALDGAS